MENISYGSACRGKGNGGFSRRDFVAMGVMAAMATGTGCVSGQRRPASAVGGRSFKTITISTTDCLFEREPMVRPFGFKGGDLVFCIGKRSFQFVRRLDTVVVQIVIIGKIVLYNLRQRKCATWVFGR